MSAIDYGTLEAAIVSQIAADSAVTAFGAKVIGDEEVSFFEKPLVRVQPVRRDAPADQQRLAAGRRTDFWVQFEISCIAFNMQANTAKAARDTLLGLVENALRTDLTFAQSNVQASWLGGGQFESGSTSKNNLYALGTIDLTVHAVSTT